MNQKIKKMIFISILTILFIFSINTKYTFADVGSFETYDSGSSWSSSDWGSSSYDYDYDYGSSGSSLGLGILLGGCGDVEGIIIIIVVIAIVVTAFGKKGPRNMPPRPGYRPNMNNIPRQPQVNETQIENQVKQIDELFNKEEFIAWSKSLFIKLQEAWTARDWETIRVFETNELFEQHRTQLQGYIDRGQINVMERICVLSASLMEFRQVGDKDVLSVRLQSRMNDYIIDEKTKQIIKGDKTTDRYSTYKLTFVRKTGVKTKAGTMEVNTTNCPNCGAPTKITSAGKCEYCGSVITTGEYSWALSNLEKIG